MPIVAVAIDVFSPGAYRASPWPADLGARPSFVEDYAHEAGYVYVALQPLLFRGLQPDGFAVQILERPSDYFSVGRVLTADDVVFATGALERRGDAAPVPVALPPHCELRLDLIRNHNVLWTSGVREIGLTARAQDPAPPFVLPLSEWPEIASVNFAHPVARAFSELDGNQGEQALTWLGAAVVDLIRARIEGHVNQLTPAQQRALQLFGQDPVPATPRAMRERLLSARRGAQMYDELLVDGPAANGQLVVLSPPRFKVVDSARFAARIDGEIRRTLPVGAEKASYLHVWWNAMCDEAGRDAAGAWRNPVAPSPFAQALGRYFGFGERLRWRRPPFDLAGAQNQVFMVPRLPSQTENAERFETNAVSLCELVFRVPIAAIAGDSAGLVARLSVAGKVLDDDVEPIVQHRLGPRIANSASAASHWTASRHCHARINRDVQDEDGAPMSDAHGIVMVQPRAAPCVPIANAPRPHMHTVATTLVDLVDNTQRLATNEDGEGLLLRGVPRRALFPEECLAFGEALAGCSTGWRLQARLQPAAVTVAVIGTLPRVYELVAAQLSTTRVPSAPDPLLASEAARFGNVLKELLARSGRYSASLWLPRNAGSIDLLPRLVDADGPASDLRFYVMDEGPGHEIGTALANIPGEGQGGVTVDIVITSAVAADRTLPFNLVQGTGNATPWIALHRGALSRVSQSVDRWMERFRVGIEVNEAFDANDPVDRHIANFNKMRVWSGDAQTGYLPLTYPDAAVPLRPGPPGGYAKSLPWESGWPTTEPARPRHTFFVAHLFSQETQTERPTLGGPDTSNDRKPERARYLRYRRARRNDRITGYLEHQYSYRIPIVDTRMTVDARIATDVRNPAALLSRRSGSVSNDAANEVEGAEASLLRIGLSEDARTLRLTVHRDYLIAVVASDNDALDPQGNARGKHVESLRTIYETIQDLESALSGGTVVLIAQAFQFDNSLPRQPGAQATNQTIPSRLSRFAIGKLRLRGDAGPGLALQDSVAQLLQPSFDDFEAKVLELAALPEGELAAAIAIPTNDAGWAWTTDSGTPLPQAPDLAKDANLVRVAIDVLRDPDRVVASDAAQGRLIPFSPTMEVPDWIKNNSADFLASARTELRDLLKRAQNNEPGSGLFYRRDWLRAVPPAGFVVPDPAMPAPAGRALAVADPALEPRSKRWRMIFGDYAPTVLVPGGDMRAVETVCEVRYVPFAFRPLQPHVAMSKSDDTAEFANFLLGVAADILSGRPVIGIPLRAATAASAGREAALARLRLEQLAAADQGIGHTLALLLQAVHNDRDLRQSTSNLVRRTLKLLDDSRDERTAGLRQVLSSTPSLFGSARAIGVVVFEPQRFSSALQSIQLCKRIAQERNTPEKLSVDVDRFVIPPALPGSVPMVFDPLETALYDAEFELPMNDYDGAFANDQDPLVFYEQPVNLGPNLSVARRGASSGRTGEDFIESRNHFPAPDDDDPKPRAIELDAPHWNPHWAYRLPGGGNTPQMRRLYLLPSRRFPVGPIMIQVSSDTGLAAETSSINLPEITGEAGQEDAVFEAALGLAMASLDQAALLLRMEGDANPGAPADALWRLDPASRSRRGHTDADGWFRVDTLLEHHYFLVESGEAETTDYPFANDKFEYEVRVRRTPGDPPPAQQAEPPPIQARSGLIDAFRAYQRVVAQLPPDPSQQPSPVDLPTVVESLAHWLCNGPVEHAAIPGDERAARGERPLLWPRPPEQHQASDADFVAEYVWASRKPALTGSSRTVQPQLSECIGSVVAVSMFAPTQQSPRSNARRIMRVTVLADPWSRITLRMRQTRNQRNVDDGAPDIDPAFAMTSPYSAWSGYAHPMRLADASYFDQAHVPDEQRCLQVVDVPLRAWLDQVEGTPESIGSLVDDRLTDEVPPGAYEGLPLWNFKQMLGDERKAAVVLRQIQPDRHQFHDGQHWTTRSERDMVVPRHVFGVIAATAIDQKLREVAPRTVTAGEPELEVTWLDNTSGAPVYRVIWPIRFRDM
jgi:hypothetical protein